MLTCEEADAIRRTFGRFPEVRAVYLLGSAAEGRRTSESDLDLAVVAEDASFSERKLEVLSELVRAGIDRVDLVLLNTADTVTSHEAVRPNQLVYRRDVFDHGPYVSLVTRKFLDLNPYLERHRNAYEQRLRRGSA